MRSLLGTDAQHTVEGIGGLVNEGFRIMGVRMEVLEGQVAVVTRFIECLDHCGPVGGTVEKGTEAFQRMIGALLGELLEVNVLNAFAELRNPMLRELEQHDVAGVEVYVQVLAAEGVDEVVHFLGR